LAHCANICELLERHF